MAFIQVKARAPCPHRQLPRVLRSSRSGARPHDLRIEPPLSPPKKTPQRELELAEARVCRVQAELARALKSWDAQNSQLEADTFDQQAHIEAVLEALPNASAITFSSE